jgi:hypothetical protein
MSLTITLNNPLAEQLQAQATARQLSVEELAVRLLGKALRQLNDTQRWSSQNARRLELLRESKSRSLGPDEQAELQHLQAVVDRQLERGDHRLRGTEVSL